MIVDLESLQQSERRRIETVRELESALAMLAHARTTCDEMANLASEAQAMLAEALRQRDDVLHYLRSVLDLIRRNGGHQWPEDQAMLRGARAVLGAP